MLYGGLYGAESVEDFTEKMADNETARAAIDAAMRGQAENENAPAEMAEAGEKSFADAQDDRAEGGRQKAPEPEKGCRILR